MNVACIDEAQNARAARARRHLHQRGLDPAKALLQSSEHFEHAQLAFSRARHQRRQGAMDVARSVARPGHRRQTKQRRHCLYLFKKNKITFFHGTRCVCCEAEKAGYEIRCPAKTPRLCMAKQIIIATGSVARALPGVAFDEQQKSSPATTAHWRIGCRARKSWA